MPLAETPAIEDQVMASDVDQRLIKRSPRRQRQDHVVERTTGNNGLDRSPSASQAAKDAEERVGHRRKRDATDVPCDGSTRTAQNPSKADSPEAPSSRHPERTRRCRRSPTPRAGSLGGSAGG